MRIRHWILLFGLANAALYSALLPLWEGFDEAYHYAYVESLWQTWRLPVLGRTAIPADVLASFPLAPVSHVVQKPIPEATSFDAWFALPRAEKERRRAELEGLHASPAATSRGNYEAHQPPLAYAILALFDWPMSRAPLLDRVLALRLIAALCSILLIDSGTRGLAAILHLPGALTDAAVFTIFCCQMLYATVAHVANDWLAVGLSAMILSALARLLAKPDARPARIAALWLAAGLVTKAYFLVFALAGAGLAAFLLWRGRVRAKTLVPAALILAVLAGPWYARAVRLYGDVSGMTRDLDGVSVHQALAAAPHIDWLATGGYLARASLWTGNNSFTSFSRLTLNVVLALLFLAMLLWAIRIREIAPPEGMIFAVLVLFAAGIGYETCMIFAFADGEGAAAAPWYSEALLPPVLLLAYLGMSRWRTWGRMLAAATVAIWTWVLLATWALKLFPMYSSGAAGPMRVRDFWSFYTANAGKMADLSLLAPAPAPLLYAVLAMVLSLGVFLCTAVIRSVCNISMTPQSNS